jgi:hypothetical protein
VTVAFGNGSNPGRTQQILLARSRPHVDRSFWSLQPIDRSVPATVAQWRPALAQGAGDTVHAAWIDERERSADDDLPQAHVFYSRVVGGKPSTAVKLDSDAPTALSAKLDHAWTPRLAVRGKRVLATWLDFQNYDWGVFSRLSTDAGSSFGPQARVTDNREDDPATAEVNEQQEELADSPSAAITSKGTPLIAWTDWRKRDSSATKPHRQYDTFIASPGARNRQVDPHGGRQVSTFAPSICAARRGHAIVAFQDSSRGRSEVRVVTMRGGTGRGRSRLVNDAGAAGGNAWRPQLACSGGRVLALWEDERDGPPRLYFARASERRLR